MPPKRRGRPSPSKKTPASESSKAGISVGLVTDEEEAEENELGGARLEFAPIGLNDDGVADSSGTEGRIILT